MKPNPPAQRPLIYAIAALCALVLLRLSWMATSEVEGLDGEQHLSAELPAPGELQPAPPPRVPTRHEQASEPATEEDRAEPTEPRAQPYVYHGRPEDPVESGPCTLTLYLVDALDGAPLSGRVELWRLNAPGNANWGQGDQLQASAKVREEGTEFSAIPAGEYRAIFRNAGVHADYAASFHVAGAHTTHTLQVHPPREVEVWLELVDERGNTLHEIELRPRYRSKLQAAPQVPPWLVERAALREFTPSSPSGAGGSYGGVGHSTWKTLGATPRGFHLGALLEGSRSIARGYHFDVRVPGGGEIELSIRDLPEPGERLVALFMDRADVLRHILLPDGRDATSIDADCDVESRSIVIDSAHPAVTWRDASIQALVSGQTRFLWTHTWSPSEGPMADVWIEEEH